MSDHIRFDGVLEPLTWGRNTYTIICIPADLAEAAERWPTRRIDGWIDGSSVNLGLNKADPDVMTGSFVYIGAGLQRRLGVAAGDLVSCEFAPADPDLVPVPEDLARAMEDAHCTAEWKRTRASERRRLLMPIDNAARPRTRADRIARLVGSLTTNQQTDS
ncbi:YdeI/OmpD-associated family protein [Rhodococcoides yunnanense]|uniref:YdeI/OmpD-associated family protein n=1 Tax=Rhodococcoides yunnanense TaxID=278209 RepID=A0ABU4B7X2_9NOCA|nr:YdeI/OmpD-associated family protein [Rhodococcus yunnanensis]MDV6260287.1 YdeI/OmpD-associated family protein [Rhodococcus yunnanensis]